MARLRIFQSINNDIYSLQFDNDPLFLSQGDKELMREFGEPEINAGGTITYSGDVVAGFSSIVGGSGYTYATASITSATGSGATATVTITSGAVSALTVTNNGYGYEDAVVTIVGDGTGATATVTLDDISGTYTLPDSYIKVRSDFPYVAYFDSRDDVYETYVLAKVYAYRDQFKNQFENAFKGLRANTDGFTNELIFTI